MLYQPPDPELRLWDTWLFPQGEKMHLFYLQRRPGVWGCHSIGHAISTDLARWETLPTALEQGPDGAWDHGPLMTGMVVEREGQYYMFYGAMVDGVQRIGVALSDDLLHWEKYPGNPILTPTGPWYETDPLAAANHETAWRDPCVVYSEEEGCYYALFCARVPDAGPGAGGCIGVARSENLLEWEVLPPAYVSERYFALEVPDVFFAGGRYYLIFSTSYYFGVRYPASDEERVNGIHYLVSDALTSGYRPPPDNTLLGAPPGRLDNHVGRTCRWRGETLFHYHHVAPISTQYSAPDGALAAIKRITATPEGRLRLHYLPALEPCTAPPLEMGPIEPLMGTWRQEGTTVQGESFPATASAFLPMEIEAAIITARLTIEEGRAAGLIFGFQDAAHTGYALLLNAEGHCLELLRLARGPGVVTILLPLRQHAVAFRQAVPYNLRLIMRRSFLDVYLDDVLLDSYVLDSPVAGRPGLVVDAARATIEDLRISPLVL